MAANYARGAARARPAAGGGRWVEISPERLPGWLDGFYGRHDGATEHGLVLTGASNGDTATLCPPPGLSVENIDGLLRALHRPPKMALLLVRKGAAGLGIVSGTAVVSSKIERFYVQGRTAAGGSSQQRFARRRVNQAEAAIRKTVDIAARVLLPHLPGPTGPGSDDPVRVLVCGGDRGMVDSVLADPRLAGIAALRHRQLLEIGEPRLALLEEAAVRARRVRIQLVP